MAEWLLSIINPLIRPSRIIVSLLMIVWLLDSKIIELYQLMRQANLSEYIQLLDFVAQNLTFYDLFISLFCAFVINPFLTHVAVAVASSILKYLSNNLTQRAYGIASAAKKMF